MSQLALHFKLPLANTGRSHPSGLLFQLLFAPSVGSNRAALILRIFFCSHPAQGVALFFRARAGCVDGVPAACGRRAALPCAPGAEARHAGASPGSCADPQLGGVVRVGAGWKASACTYCQGLGKGRLPQAQVSRGRGEGCRLSQQAPR